MTTQDSDFANLQKAFKEYGDLLVSVYRQKLVQYGVDASGTLGNTLDYIIEKDNNLYRLSLNIQDYWKYVEDGRRPGKFPPVSAIKQWIRIKPVLPSGFTGKLPSTDQLAYLIGRKIATKGTRGKYILKDTLEDIGSFEAFSEAIEKDLNVQIDDIFIDLKE